MDHSAHSGHAMPVGHSMHDMDMHSNHISDSEHSVSPACGEHGMSMSFHFGVDEVILFDQWHPTTVGGLVGSMFGIVLMAALYEGLKYYREYLFWKTYNDLQYTSMRMRGDKSTSSGTEESRIVRPTMWSWMHCYQTFLHMVQIVLSYFIMLIFMTYNVWLCIAVVIGAAIGYFLFGWKKSVVVDVTEHCH
ncbi:UNVERIFIED_CONTAM: hypothetical protein PYX00_003703 [Menopon gallinae]|uniref:Copper transport protein n=1 Tax=Menopon gallinae TaxID=328185 RepID=A0AAW2I2A7_9NEOP